MIIKYPYCDVARVFFFGNLAQPSNSLEDYIKEYKQLDPDWEKNYYDNLWELYEEVDEVLK